MDGIWLLRKCLSKLGPKCNQICLSILHTFKFGLNFVDLVKGMRDCLEELAEIIEKKVFKSWSEYAIVWEVVKRKVQN